MSQSSAERLKRRGALLNRYLEEMYRFRFLDMDFPPLSIDGSELYIASQVSPKQVRLEFYNYPDIHSDKRPEDREDIKMAYGLSWNPYGSSGKAKYQVGNGSNYLQFLMSYETLEPLVGLYNNGISSEPFEFTEESWFQHSLVTKLPTYEEMQEFINIADQQEPGFTGLVMWYNDVDYMFEKEFDEHFWRVIDTWKELYKEQLSSQG